MEKLTKVIGIVVLIVALMAVFALLMGLPVMWLWNWLMPAIFGLKSIGFWQAVGLNLLCCMLFKSYSSSKSSK